MVIAQERYHPLDADRKPYVRHGRDGLPAVWSRGMWFRLLQRPMAGSFVRSIKNAAAVLLPIDLLLLHGWNAFSIRGMNFSVLGKISDGGPKEWIWIRFGLA